MKSRTTGGDGSGAGRAPGTIGGGSQRRTTQVPPGEDWSWSYHSLGLPMFTLHADHQATATVVVVPSRTALQRRRVVCRRALTRVKLTDAAAAYFRVGAR